MKTEHQNIVNTIIHNMETMNADSSKWMPAWINADADVLPDVVTDAETSAFDTALNTYYSREKITYIEKLQSRSFYAPDADIIMLPSKKQFITLEGYYAVKAHETIHSTGDYTRCFREGFDEFKSVMFGSSKYSREELTAEIGACFLLNALNIDTSEAIKSASIYLYNWRSKLNNNNRWIYNASELAQEAVIYIMDIIKG